MAQLKDSIVSGNLRVSDTLLSGNIQATTIKAPTTAGGTTYGAGTNGQVIRSNGTSSYWGSITNSDLTTVNNTVAGPLGWTSSTQGTAIPTLNTIAYWNGAYGTGSATSSNLEYCKIGKFGSIITKASTDYIANTQAGLNAAINLLGAGSSDPQLADYYISQYAGGGTTTTTYHRRPLSNLWNTFRGLITLTTSGSGNAVTSVSIANGTGSDASKRIITVTKGSTFLTQHPTITINTDTTSTASPSAGGTFTAVDSVTRDTNGHVTKINTKTVTLPADENVKSTALALSTASNTYYPVFTTSGTTNTNTLNKISSYRVLHTPGTASDEGNTRVVLGNSTAAGNADNEIGLIRLYSNGTSYHTIKGDTTNASGGVDHILPSTGGTVLNTGTTSYTATITSGTKLGTITINSSDTDIYMPDTKNKSTTLASGADLNTLYTTQSPSDVDCEVRKWVIPSATVGASLLNRPSTYKTAYPNCEIEWHTVKGNGVGYQIMTAGTNSSFQRFMRFRNANGWSSWHTLFDTDNA